MKQETIAVPVESVRELKEMVEEIRLKPGNPASACVALCFAIRNLPDPPKPDVVEECAKAYWIADGSPFQHGDAPTPGFKRNLRAALRRYRELGCPELDE